MAGGSLTQLVRERLNQDPLWRHQSSSGAWICPYCLSSVRGGDSTRASLTRAVEAHIGRRCAGWHNGKGKAQDEHTIGTRRAYEDIAHFASTDPAWQVFDHEGFWYSPTSLQRIDSIRLTNGRFDSFTIQSMVNHLMTCPHYRAGTFHPVAQVQRFRDSAVRASQLTGNIQQLLQYSLWRYANAEGSWVCPFCLDHIKTVPLRAQEDWTYAPQRMAWHVAAECRSYVPDRPSPKIESMVQQAAARPPGSTASRPGVPTLTAPQRSARSTTQTGLPVAKPTSRFNLRSMSGEADDTHAGRTPLPGTITPTPTRLTTPVTGTARLQRPAADPGDVEPLGGPDPLEGTIFASREHGGDGVGEAAPAGSKPAPATSEKGEVPFSWMDDVEEKAGQSSRELHTDTERIRARDVQQGMLSKVPRIPGYTFATRFEACHDISGDFYEFISLPDGRIAFAQGDVSGHGMHAGLIMSMAKKTISLIGAAGKGPAETLALVNDSLADDLGGRIFISVTYAILNPHLGTITWARAGHNPTIRYNPHTDEIEEIRPKGMVVGMKKGAIFRNSIEEAVTSVRAGDLFLVYTDGITETMNRQDLEYGTELLNEVIRKHGNSGPEVLVDRIMDSIRQFRGGTVAGDDTTLLALGVD